MDDQERGTDGFVSRRDYRIVVCSFLGLLSFLVLRSRIALNPAGMLDMDALNLGLSAFDYDILEHRPHPPGYIGYSLFLKVVHFAAPALAPLDVALWGSRVFAVLTVLAAYYAARGLEGPVENGELLRLPFRSFAAVLLAAFHPLLWYYGCDGQSHSSESFAYLLLFGLAVRVKRRPSRGSVYLFVALVGLFGALRPTITLLTLPLVLWLLWSRPWVDWGLSALLGTVGLLLWLLPTFALAGGYEMYLRTYRALVSETFVSRFSVLSGASGPFVEFNLNLALVSFSIAALPMLCAGWGVADVEERPRWRRPWMVLIFVSLAFYSLVYIAESGYFAGTAALCCLTPMTWPKRIKPLNHRVLRFYVVLSAGVFFLFAGPREVPAYGVHSRDEDTGEITSSMLKLPTAASVLWNGGLAERYRERVCDWGSRGGALLITDNQAQQFARYFALVCGDFLYASYVEELAEDGGPRALLLYEGGDIHTLPTVVPLESGPAGIMAISRPLSWVMLGPFAGKRLTEQIVEQASCSPIAGTGEQGGEHLWPQWPLVWPARCFENIKVGPHRLLISP